MKDERRMSGETTLSSRKKFLAGDRLRAIGTTTATVIPGSSLPLLDPGREVALASLRVHCSRLPPVVLIRSSPVYTRVMSDKSISQVTAGKEEASNRISLDPRPSSSSLLTVKKERDREETRQQN